MRSFLKIVLILVFLAGFSGKGLSQGLTITGTVEANDLTISGTVNAGALTTVRDLGVLGNLYVAQSFLPTNIIVAGSITASGSIRATGTVSGGALSVNNNSIVGGALSVVGALSAGNFQASTVTGNTGFLQMRQTGDTYGESGLYVYNRNGSNGPVFYTGNNVDLVDLGYLSLTSNSQFNMRFEHRSASVVNTANNTTGEFQMFNTRQNGTDVGTAFGAFGPAVSSLTGTLSVAALTSTGVAVASDFSTTTAGSMEAGTGGIFTTGALTGASLSTSGTITASGINVSGSLTATRASITEDISTKNVNQGFATSASGVTLNTTSVHFQEFTGASAATFTLPNTATLVLGESYRIMNNGTANLTINSSTGVLIVTLPPNGQTLVTCVSTAGNTAAAWSQATSNSFTTGGGGGAILTSTGAISNAEAGVLSSIALPADRLLTGSVIRITLEGRAATTNTTGTGVTFRVRIGSNGSNADPIVAGFTFPNSVLGVTVTFRAVLDLTVRSTGASAVATGVASYTASAAGGFSSATAGAASPSASNTFNTTTSGNIVSVYAITSGNNQSLILSGAIIEFVNR